MPRSIDETRRDFLLRLAKSAAFVPPAITSVAVGRVSAQGKGNGNGQPNANAVANANANSAVARAAGSLSPTAQLIENPAFRLQQGSAASPWAPGQPGAPPPWATPPPTQTGK